MKRIIALAVALLLYGLAGTGPGAVFAHLAAYQHDHFIVPGERIGPLVVGMPTTSAVAILRSMGRYRKTNEFTHCSGGYIGTCFGEKWRFADDSREAAAYTPGRVLWVGTADLRMTTREGFGPYDTLTIFYRRYGQPQWADAAWDEWWYAGIATMSGRRVHVVVVFASLSRVVPYPVDSQ